MRKLFAGLALLAILVLVLGAWVTIRKGFSARDNPSSVEALAARTARSLATPAAVKSMKNPQQPSAENIREGLEHFADHCAQCHSNDGSGNTEWGRNMYPKPPDMRTRVTQDLTDGEIYSIIQNGIRLTGMPAFGTGRTDDTGTWNLVLFIRHLPKLTAEEKAAMEKLNPRAPHEMEEMKEIEDFLSNGESKTSSQPKQTKKH